MISIAIEQDKLIGVEGEFSEENGVVLTRMGEQSLSPGMMDNGDVKKGLDFYIAMGRLIVSAGFESKRVRLTLSGGSILSRRLELPDVSRKEIVRIARNEMLQISSGEEYVYDCSILGTSIRPGVCVVWAYAVPRKLIENYLNVVHNLHLKPVSFDIRSNAVEKLFLRAAVNNFLPDGARVFAQLDKRGIDLHLLADGERAFTRFAPVGFGELNMLLGHGNGRPEIDTSPKDIDLSSEKIKNDSILGAAVQRYVSGLSEELQKIILFQRRRNSENPVRCVLLYGDLSDTGGLCAALTETLGIPVQTIRSISSVRVPSDMPVHHAVNAVGALIQFAPKRFSSLRRPVFSKR